ncbi:MAG TPA: hypothetical protein VFN79_06345 [Steroidobacteraceae bacterium]|nr:hypothetical protein [Steroidobacteraceae bacterium]
METERLHRFGASYRKVLHEGTNLAFFVAGAITLAFGTWHAIRGQPGTAATLLASGLLLLFAATVDRFESLKGLGIEAKTRQLDRKIEEADEALARLRGVAELMSTALIDLNCKVGRWDSASTPRESYELSRKVHSLLKALDTADSQIRATLAPAARTICRDLGFALTNSLRRAAIDEEQKLNKERAEIPQPINPSDPKYAQLTERINELRQYRERLTAGAASLQDDYPEVLLKLVEDAPIADAGFTRQTAEEFARDMRQLQETFVLRNPERWFEAIEAARRP